MFPSQKSQPADLNSLQFPITSVPLTEIHTKGIPNVKVQNDLFLYKQQKPKDVLPIVLQRHIQDDKKYIVIAGEQLLFWFQEKNLISVPSFVISDIEVDQNIVLYILRKIHPYLHCLEEAYLYNYLLSQEQLSEHIEVGRSTISRILKLTSLPHIIQEDVLQYRLSVSLAKEFSTISNFSLCMKLYAQHQKNKFTVAQLREQIKKLDQKQKKQMPMKIYSLQEIQEKCFQFFERSCSIKQNTIDCTLEVTFDSLTDLQTWIQNIEVGYKKK